MHYRKKYKWEELMEGGGGGHISGREEYPIYASIGTK